MHCNLPSISKYDEIISIKTYCFFSFVYHWFCMLTSGISTGSQCLSRKTALSCSCEQYSLMGSKQGPNNRAVHPYMELVPVQLHRHSKKYKVPDQGEQVNHGLQAPIPARWNSPYSPAICAKPPPYIHTVLYAAQLTSTTHFQLQ